MKTTKINFEERIDLYLGYYESVLELLEITSEAETEIELVKNFIGDLKKLRTLYKKQ